jgi:uncharacterized protein
MSLLRSYLKITWQAHWLRWALCGLIAVTGVLVPKTHGCPPGLPVWHITVKGVSLTLEIAATPEQRECGLSNRVGLPTDAGMLFVLPETMPFAVWMKDTRMPLSVAFLDAAGQILAIEQMAPLKTDVIYESPRPVRYAIEVNRGWFIEHHVRVGDSIHLKLPPGLDIH